MKKPSTLFIYCFTHAAIPNYGIYESIYALKQLRYNNNLKCTKPLIDGLQFTDCHLPWSGALVDLPANVGPALNRASAAFASSEPTEIKSDLHYDF